MRRPGRRAPPGGAAAPDPRPPARHGHRDRRARHRAPARRGRAAPRRRGSPVRHRGALGRARPGAHRRPAASAAGVRAQRRTVRRRTRAAAPRIRELVDTDLAVAETLLAWCQRFGNVARTAADLGVHENTVRARLRRAERTHGIPLEDPDTLLTIWLQLRSEGVAA
ncbi:helix-turn-helix domain-containing protein [Leucobacter sp. HNU]|uniref:helix-turn-helix domain-containing protein n=1 Tax=Leucobacter sp. HNU TaxID=3236805 RepID=UPI003A80C3C4